MASLAPSIVIAVWASTVQARNETLTHGWRPEPQGRGTWSILWSCLATIFICTWSALHLDVPKRQGRWYLLFRKLGFMLLAAAAPEGFLVWSADCFFDARDLVKQLNERGNHSWKLTHMQFAAAKSFQTRTPEGDINECSVKQLFDYIENKSIDDPSLSEEELRAREKSDIVVKLVAVLQIIWFVVQTLFRAIQHYQITALEIVTVAFVFCSIFTYGFALYRQQDVVYPVILEIRNVASATKEATPGRDSDKPSHVGKDADPPIHRPEREHSDLPRGYVPGWTPEIIPWILFGIFGCGFGALHCLAWNSPFPTSKERLAWRICSVTITALPALFTPLAYAVVPVTNLSKRMGIIAPIAVPYILGRATIIVLAFMTLRLLPDNVYQTINWSDYIPHFAA